MAAAAAAQLQLLPKSEDRLQTAVNLKEKLELLQRFNNVEFTSVIESYTCVYCAKVFTDLRVLKSHVGIHTGERPFPCSHCQRCFKNKYQLRDHLRVHTGEKPFKCPHCPKAFAQKNQLNLHLPTHNSERPFVCGLCGKSFKIATTLQTHLKFHSDERPYVCPVCQFAFHLPSLLRSHMRTHTGERPYPCKFCGKRFKTASTRKVHERSHEPEPAFKCPECDRSFTYASNLAMHRRTHKDKDQHTCIHCGDVSLTVDSMRHHIESVHGKMYKCNICKEAFALKPLLDKHIEHHRLNGNAFTCYHCHKTFDTREEYRHHSINLPCVKLYGCGKCDLRFETISQLNSHMWSHKPPRSNRRGRPPKRYVEDSAPLTNGNTATMLNSLESQLVLSLSANLQAPPPPAPPSPNKKNTEQSNEPSETAQFSLQKDTKSSFENSLLNLCYEPRLFCGICFSEHTNNEDLQNHLQQSHPIEGVDPPVYSGKKSPSPPTIDPSNQLPERSSAEQQQQAAAPVSSSRKVVHTVSPANHSLLQKYVTLSVSDDDYSEENEEMQFREMQAPFEETSRRTKRLKQGWRSYMA